MIKGILVQCEEHKRPLWVCVRATLAMPVEMPLARSHWWAFFRKVLGDDGCPINSCGAPAVFWTKSPWGCACTKRVCRKHSQRRKVAEDACVCPTRRTDIGRSSNAGDPSPWQENAIRHLEDRDV